MAEALQRRLLSQRLSWTALALSLGAVAVALIGSIGAGEGAWPYHIGFVLVRWALLGAAAAALATIVAWALARRSGLGRTGMVNLAALIVALAFLFYLGSQVAAARSAPPIHDATTNLNDIPKFYRLVVRDDNLAAVPDLDRPRLRAMAPRDRWKAIHREAYPDLRTERVPWPVADTVARAEQLARDRGWDVITADPRIGIVEAVDTSTFFRFRDNVLVRVQPAPGGGSLVDMRSTSREVASDTGENADRIRAFMKDLAAA